MPARERIPKEVTSVRGITYRLAGRGLVDSSSQGLTPLEGADHAFEGRPLRLDGRPGPGRPEEPVRVRPLRDGAEQHIVRALRPGWSAAHPADVGARHLHQEYGDIADVDLARLEGVAHRASVRAAELTGPARGV